MLWLSHRILPCLVLQVATDDATGSSTEAPEARVVGLTTGDPKN